MSNTNGLAISTGETSANRIIHALNQGRNNHTTQQEELAKMVREFFDVDSASTYIKTLNILISCITNPNDPIYYQLEGLTISNSISTVNSLTELIVELQENHLTNQNERLLSCIDDFFNFDTASSYIKTLNFLFLCITDMDDELREDWGERFISNTRSKINDLSTFLIELQEKNNRLQAAK